MLMSRPVRDIRDQEKHYICDSQEDQVPPPGYLVKPIDRRLVTHRATFYIRSLVERTIGAADPQGWYASTFDGATTTFEGGAG